MSVEFTDEKSTNGDDYYPSKTSIMVKWVMKTGIVKNEKQANIVLLSLAIIFFIITFILITPTFNKPEPKTIYIEDIPASDRAELPPEFLKTLPSRNN